MYTKRQFSFHGFPSLVNFVKGSILHGPGPQNVKREFMVIVFPQFDMYKYFFVSYLLRGDMSLGDYNFSFRNVIFQGFFLWAQMVLSTQETHASYYSLRHQFWFFLFFFYFPLNRYTCKYVMCFFYLKITDDFYFQWYNIYLEYKRPHHIISPLKNIT